MLRSELVFRFGVSSSPETERESSRSELIAMDSRERGEPPLLWAEEVGEYGDGGSSCECECADMASCDGDTRARKWGGGGEREVRRRLRV